METEEVSAVVGLLNEIFDLQVSWLERHGIVDDDAIINLKNLVQRLVDKLKVLKIGQSAVYLSRHSRITRRVNDKTVSMDEYLYHKEYEEQPGYMIAWIRDAKVADKPLVWNYFADQPSPAQSAPISYEQAQRIFDSFVTLEWEALTKAGFNQQSVAIIIESLISNRNRISRFLLEEREITLGGFDHIIRDLQSRVNRPETLNTTAHKKTARLNSIKDKVVGIATIFGDAVPLIAECSLDVVSIVSVVAGAGVAAAWPAL